MKSLNVFLFVGLICVSINIGYGQDTLAVDGDINISGRLLIGPNQSIVIGRGNGSSGSFNTIIGYEAARDNQTGHTNVIIGRWAGLVGQDADQNTYVGNQAGKFNKSGNLNTMIGDAAGLTNKSSRNTFVGANADGIDDQIKNAVAIGYFARVGCSDCAVLGRSDRDQLSVGIGVDTPLAILHLKQRVVNNNTMGLALEDSDSNDKWEIVTLLDQLTFERNGAVKAFISSVDGAYTSMSDMRLKKGISELQYSLDDILQLNPRSYSFIDDTAKNQSIGLIAQEVQELFPEIVASNGQYLGIKYDGIAVLAIQAIKELTKQIKTERENYQYEINALKSMIHDLQKRINGISKGALLLESK